MQVALYETKISLKVKNLIPYTKRGQVFLLTGSFNNLLMRRNPIERL